MKEMADDFRYKMGKYSRSNKQLAGLPNIILSVKVAQSLQI